MQKARHLKIYQSKWHLAFSIFLIIVPFVFLLLFSRFAQISTTKLFEDLLLSSYRMIISYLIAALIGWGLAVLFYKGKKAIVALPLFDVLQSFPTFAALPIATFFWGASDFTVIFFLIITIVWPIFFSVVSSLKLVRHDWQEVTEVFGLSGIPYIKYFLIPVSMPGLITGSIVGLGEGWEALIATEIIVNSPTGLGSFFQSFSQNLTITALGILGFLLLIFSINKLVWFSLLEWSHKKMES